jgi:hypothetical protein
MYGINNIIEMLQFSFMSWRLQLYRMLFMNLPYEIALGQNPSQKPLGKRRYNKS